MRTKRHCQNGAPGRESGCGLADVFIGAIGDGGRDGDRASRWRSFLYCAEYKITKNLLLQDYADRYSGLCDSYGTEYTELGASIVAY